MQSTEARPRIASARQTWRSASFAATDRRKNPPERRVETDRAVTGERRKSAIRTLAALLRF